jgi:hypothetical protein|tara:strand:+ start:859 stop:1014 length:156 start_codon:yes stop_codon:yes gene_type:complete
MDKAQWLKVYLPDDLAADMRDKLKGTDRNQFITTSLRAALTLITPVGKTNQ